MLVEILTLLCWWHLDWHQIHQVLPQLKQIQPTVHVRWLQTSCLKIGLSGGTVHAVECLQNGECSGPAYRQGYTAPDVIILIEVVSVFLNNALTSKYVLAPVNTFVMRLPMTGFDISLSGCIGNPQVSSFIVDVKSGFINKASSLSRYARPLVCFFTGLMAGSRYTLRAFACSSE